MITAAVIFTDTGHGEGGEALAPRPTDRLGGLTLLERALLTAARAGARTCYVVGVPPVPTITFSPGPASRCKAVFLSDLHDCAFARTMSGAVLVFSVDVVFSVSLAKALDDCLTRTGVPSVYIPDVPLAIVQTGLLPSQSREWWSAPGQNHGAVAFAPHGHFVRRLGPAISTAVVEQELIAALANPQDGVLDRYLNRPLSRRLTRLLAPLPVSANFITVLSLTVGLAGALCFAAGDYFLAVIGVLLLQVSAVLDCCDGELARLRFEESRLGHWLDIGGDTVVHIAVFGGIAWGVAIRDHGWLPLLTGAVLVAGVLPAFALVTYAERVDVVRKTGDLWEGRAIERMLTVLTNRDFYVCVLLFTLLGALRWFLWGAALGAHVFWLVLLWLLWRVRVKQWDRGFDW